MEKTNIKEALHAAIDSVWIEVSEEFKRETYAELSGYRRAAIRVVNGTLGTAWFASPLSELVDQYIETRDGGMGEEEPGWCDAIAKDLEQQAIRLRAHAEALRQIL